MQKLIEIHLRTFEFLKETNQKKTSENQNIINKKIFFLMQSSLNLKEDLVQKGLMDQCFLELHNKHLIQFLIIYIVEIDKNKKN